MYIAGKMLGMDADAFFRLTPVGFTELLRAASGKRKRKTTKVDNVDQIPGGMVKLHKPALAQEHQNQKNSDHNGGNDQNDVGEFFITF